MCLRERDGTHVHRADRRRDFARVRHRPGDVAALQSPQAQWIAAISGRVDGCRSPFVSDSRKTTTQGLVVGRNASLGQILLRERPPYLGTLRAKEQMMPVPVVGTKLVEIGLAAGCRERMKKGARDLRCEETVVRRVDPQHGRGGGLAEMSGGVRQQVGAAIV